MKARILFLEIYGIHWMLLLEARLELNKLSHKLFVLSMQGSVLIPKEISAVKLLGQHGCNISSASASSVLMLEHISSKKEEGGKNLEDVLPI